MKKQLTFIFALTALYGCQEYITTEGPKENVPATRADVDLSDNYYWCDGVKIPLTVNENKLFVLVETAKFESVSKLAVNAGGKLENSKTIEDYAALGIISSGKEAGMQRSLTSFTLDKTDLKSVDTKEVVYVAPYFKTDDGADIGITNVFSVQLKRGDDLAKLRKIAEENNLDMLGENQFDTSIYYLSCTNESKGNALEMANFMYESGAFEYATPEFLVESMPAVDPNDTHFGSQWGLKNNSYPGIDINYGNAMSLVSTSNLSNISVAVVDNGLFPHTDIPSRLGGYNAHTGGCRIRCTEVTVQR